MRSKAKNTIEKSEYVSSTIPETGCYIPSTLQKFCPRNFDKEENEHRKG